MPPAKKPGRKPMTETARLRRRIASLEEQLKAANYDLGVTERHRDKAREEVGAFKDRLVIAENSVIVAEEKLAKAERRIDALRLGQAQMKAWVEGVFATQFPRAPTPPWAVDPRTGRSRGLGFEAED